MSLVSHAGTGISIAGLERPARNTSRLAALDDGVIQHDGSLVKDELEHAMIVAGPIPEDLQTNEVDKVVVQDVASELNKEVLSDVGEVGKRAVLELIGTEAAVGEDEDVPMDGRLVELVDIRGLGPAHVWVLEVGADHDGAFRDLEVAVNEVNAKNLLGIVADEQSRKILDVLIRNVRLGFVVLEAVVPGGEEMLASVSSL